MRNAIVKPKLVFIGLIGVCLMLAGQSYALNIAPENIVGIWLFDDDPNDGVKDSSDNGNDAEIVGDVEGVDEGNFGKALLFPGLDGNFIEVPHNDSLNLETYSFTLWVKIEATGTFQSVMIKTEGNSNIENYSGYIFAGTNVFWTRFTSGGGAQWGFQQFGTTPVTDNEWHHLAGTYDKTSVKSYVDGVVEAEADFSGDLDPSPGSLHMGDNPGYTYPVKGLMDDISLFNVALTEDEIIEIMDNGLANVLAVAPAGKLAVTWGSIKK